MPPPLTQSVMNMSECSNPSCTHEDHPLLHFHGRCHLKGPVNVVYEKATGILKVTCAICGKFIANILVAP